MNNLKSKYWSVPLMIGLVLLLQFCTNSTQEDTLAFLNHHDTVDYVGKEQCVTCHQDVHAHFSKTGMGQSFDKATKSKSSAEFGHQVVYDSILQLYYEPFWRDSQLIIKEFRLDGKDTIHVREERMDYIIGSGQHTNSHLTEENGIVRQAPITFYTQRGVWDLAPGFEKGANSRFTRVLEQECLTCHNAYPAMKEGTEVAFDYLPLGIDCERCHGPGELHVNAKLGKVQLPEGEHGIVHPRKLSIEQQNSLCQRCHLQGVAVLKEGKDYFDFKPGMLLSDVMDVFMPKFKGDDGPFIMASHVERLSKSECFKAGDLSCISCHHPHYSVKETPKVQFNNACKNCHGDWQGKHKDKVFGSNDCISCHMKQSGSVDIPHVAITDHFIRVNGNVEGVENQYYMDIYSINTLRPEKNSILKAYLSFYDKYSPQEALLDSFRSKAERWGENQFVEEMIYYYFLKKEYEQLIEIVLSHPSEQFNAWTNYRIGEAYLILDQSVKAIIYLNQAVQQEPYRLTVKNKLAAALIRNNQLEEAKQELQSILAISAKDVSAITNRGYIAQLSGNVNEAFVYYDKALDLNPDHLPALENKISLLLQKGAKGEVKRLLEQRLRFHPDDQKSRTLLRKING